MEQTEQAYIEAARAFPPEERFRRTAIGLVAMVQRDLMEAGRVYSAPGRPNWHSLQVFLLLRGSCMELHCERFLQQTIESPDEEERAELLAMLGGPLEPDGYIEAICAELAASQDGSA